jgi:hypothetical protein
VDRGGGRDSLRRESYVSYLGKAAGLQSGLSSLAVDITLPDDERERRIWELAGARLIDYQASAFTDGSDQERTVVEAMRRELSDGLLA